MSIKGVPSAVGFPHCAGSGEGLFLSPKPYPHKYAETGAYHVYELGNLTGGGGLDIRQKKDSQFVGRGFYYLSRYIHI